MILALTVSMPFIIRTLVIFVILGLCVYLVDRYVPMAEPIKVVFRVIIVLLLILWLLSAFGIV